MSEFKVLEVATDERMLEFSQYLWRHGLAHRVIEHDGRQLLLVRHRSQIDPVRDLYARLSRGESLPEQPVLPIPRSSVLRTLRRVPVTTTLVLLSVLGFLIASFNTPLLGWLTFFEFDQVGGYTFFSTMKHQYWRLLTPVFLHFSLMHIVFNMLWLWDLGRRVELVQGRLRLLLIVLLIGVGSNITQAVFAQTAIFGGMSGVDYGLLGYCWLWGWLRKDPVLYVPVPIVIAMLAMLVLSMTGFMQLMGAGAVANAAHVGGLIMGLLLGAYMILVLRSAR